MSVVVYKDGVLAADTRAYGGNYQPTPGSKAKIHCLENGSRVGLISNIIGEPERFLDWLKSGADPSEWKGEKPNVRALMVDADDRIFLADDSAWFSGPIDCSSYAIGSGADFAMGAMAMGASATRAVEVACQLDRHCGLPVMTLRAT